MTPQENLRRALLNDEFPGDAQEDRLFSPTGTDSLRQNRNIALSAWMTQVSGQDINAGSQTWQQDKDALVQGFFKNPTASNVSDDEIHGLVRSHIQTTEEAATMAAESALIGAPLTQMMGGFSLPNISTRQGVSGRMPIYKQDALKRYNALSIKLAPYRNLVNQVSGELRKEMESEVPTTDKLESMAERLLSVNPEDRPLVLKAIGATGGKDAKERASYLSKLAGAMGRMAETMGGSVESVAARLGGTIQELADAPAAIAGLLSGGTSLQGEAATAKARSEESAAMRDKIDNLTLLTQQIRTVADQEIDPIKGDNWWSQTGIDVARMIPQSAVTIANPALGMAANWAYFENTIAGEAMLQDPKLTPQQARSIAGVSAPLNAAVETVTALIPFGRVKLPFVQKWLQATATSLPTTAARFGVRAAVGTAAEIGEEYIQAWTPLKAQELLGALQKDMPGVDWENRMPKFSDIAAQTWGPALVFSLVGAGSVSISEINGGRALANDVDLMVAQGLAPAKAQSIATAAEANNWQQVDMLFRDDFVKPEKATDTEKAEATQRFLAKIQAQQQTETINSKEAAQIGVRVFRDAGGWKVETAGGNVIGADSAEAARRIRDDIKTAGTEYEAETMAGLVDDLVTLQPQMRVELRPEVAASTGEGIEFTDPITGKTTKMGDAKSFQNLRDQAEAISGNQSESARLILGDNYFEFGEGIARVFRRARGTEAVPQAITAAHEVIENSFRRGLIAGQWTENDARNAIGSLLPALESGITRLGAKVTAEERLWLDNAKRAVAEGDSNLVREVISEMGVRTWIGRDRDGNKTGLRPGTILRALDAAILQEAKPENVTTYQRIRAWFKAVGAYLKGVVATAKIIRDAERNGTIDDFTGFLDKVLGIETATREENEVKQDVQNMAFSLAPEMQSRAKPQTIAPVTEMPDGFRIVGPTTFSITAYHGTPHKVDRFRMAKIGTGEGAQAYGWGLYFAKSRMVAKQYQASVTSKQPGNTASLMWGIYGSGENFWIENGDLDRRGPFKTRSEAEAALLEVMGEKGNLYTVELLPDEGDFLDWDKPLSEQSKKVRAALAEMAAIHGGLFEESLAPMEERSTTGASLYSILVSEMDAQRASRDMKAAGIPGIRYLDGGSRGAGDGTRNYVIFDESLVKILEENGQKVDAGNMAFSISPVTPEQDAAYLALAKEPEKNRTLLQNMVDESAGGGQIIKNASTFDFKTGVRYVVNAFHGSKSQTPITVFDKSKLGSNTFAESAKKGFFFAGSKETASSKDYYIRREFEASEIGEEWVRDYNKAIKSLIREAVELTSAKEVNDLPFGSGEFVSEWGDVSIDTLLDGSISDDPEYIMSSRMEFLRDELAPALEALGVDAKADIGALSASLPDSYLDTSEGQMVNAYLFLNNPMVFDDNGNEYREQSYADRIDEALENGHDSVIIKNTFDGGPLDAIFVVFDPSQIKSADPVTRDDAGNVIPLSERFNEASPNINFSISPVTPEQDAAFLAAAKAGDVETAQRLVDEAEKKAGFESGWFHGSNQKINTFSEITADDLKGFYLTASQDYAKKYGKIVHKLAVKYTNPLNLNGVWSRSFIERFARKLDERGITIPKSDIAEIFEILDEGELTATSSKTDNRFSEYQSLIYLKDAINNQMNKDRQNYARERGYTDEAWLKADSLFPKNDGWKILTDIITSDGYDAIYRPELSGGIYLAEQGIDPLSLVVFDPSQIKSADPVTYDDAGNIIPLSQRFNPETPNINFSISPIRNLNELSDQVERNFAENPAGALEVKSRVIRQFAKLADKWSNERWTPQGNKIRPISEKRTVKSLDKEQAMRQATLEGEKIAANMEAGQALQQAKAEAQAWRDEADAMQKEDWSPRESLVRDLITLEAIVAMFPQEIRGKIGGFVTLARKASEAARLKVLQRQLERGQELLEKHLKEQYGTAVDKLFDKYRPERKAGEKPKGKLDPDAQEIADKSESVMDLNADQVNAEIAAINVLLDADNISAEDEAKLEAMRELVQLLGDWKNADSARRESAFLALNDVLSEGWAKWKLKQLLKREQREDMRKALKSATGKKGVASERDKMKLESAKVLGKAARWVLNLSSFGEVMKAVFGEKAARQFIDNERNASNQYEDAIQEFSERIDEFFTTLAGGVLRGERLRFDLAQPTLTIGAGGMNERNISQLQGIQALLMWQQEDGKRHMEGPRDESGAPIEGKWSYDQAWIDELTSKLSPEAVEVKKFIEQLYSEEWVPLNAVYRERHGVNLPRHDKYAPITVTPQQAKAGEMVDPVSGAAIAGSILTPGSLRSRNRSALAEPEFRDALSTFIAHTKQMEHWKAYYDLAVEMQAVLGNRDVANSVKAAVGDEGATVLRKWVDAFAQGGTRDAAAGLAVSDGLGRLAGRVATVGLLGRFSTLLVQSTQLAAASIKMPTGAYLKRFALLMSGNLQWSDAINSEFIQRRIKSAPPIIRQAFQSLGEATRPNEIQRVTRFFGQLLSGADGLFTAGTYAILLDYHRTQGAKMGMEGEALESYAHEEAVNATEQVAQPVRTGTRSIVEVTNTNPLAKMSWAYASEARQKMALFAWSAYNAKNDPAGAAKTAFLVFVIGGLMSQVLKNLWREAKGDDDEKKWSAERLSMSMLSPITSAIPGASMLAGEGGSLSGAEYAQYAIKDVFDGKADMKDVDTLLSVAGYFNDTAGGISTLSHAGYDFAKVLENAFGEE